MTLIPAGRP